MPIRFCLQGSLFILILALVCANVVLAETPAGPVDYTTQIKPILSDRCYTCHGPDAEKREADLRLDDRKGAIEHAIVPGKASESALFKRLTTSDLDERMPPSDSKKPALSTEQIALVKRWIDEGAKFDAHWAFETPARPKLPTVKNSDWSKHPIDQFVLSRLEREGLTPSPRADRRTLCRRLSFDLTGLPPTPELVAEFEADKSPDAYERLVERLLGSVHYGERMAMQWLDLVRYADTNGIHGDNHREHWLYRDYVINAFNENKPFDQFTIEQIAGDLLPGATRDQKIASGYNRLNMTTREGGAQAKEYRAKYAADRVRNVSTVWMGATMGCAECHNHKFDPFTMKDFYSLASFFADIQETAVGTQAPTRMPTPAQQAEIQEFNGQIAAAQKVMSIQTPELDAAQLAWERSLKDSQIAWTPLQPAEAKSSDGSELKINADGTVVSGPANPASDTYTVTVKTKLKDITAFRLEVLPHNSLPQQGPGRASNGNLVLSELEVLASDVIGDQQPVVLQNASATHEQKGLAAAQVLDGVKQGAGKGWAIHPHVGKESVLVVETKENLGKGSDDEETTITFILHQNHGSQHTIGRFRLSGTAAARPVKAQPKGNLPKKLVTILELAPEKRDPKQKDALSAHYRTIAPGLAETRKQLAELKAKKSAYEKTLPSVLIAVSVKPAEMRILPRGNWLDDSGPVVKPAVPESLGALELGDRRGSRLDLAHWIVEKDNPVVARVIVNRFWKIAFGAGLVKTLDDFGSQGALPSHSELLDWLAVEFVESGWDVRHMMQLIVTSATYQQASTADKDLRKLDPHNRLLARQGRFRLDAEMVRDNALSISGLLVNKQGGPSVKPYQPAGYWSHLNFPKRKYQADQNENQYRRGLYAYWCRTFLHPSLRAFDASTREECAVERPRSNTPLQALVLLNDPTYVESARVFAEQIISSGGKTPKDRVAFAVRRALQRAPSAEESKILTSLYSKHLEQYAGETESASEVATTGLAKPSEKINPAELAAWTSVARVILNLHETITRN